MTTEIGVPGKTIHYINLHKEGTSVGELCNVDEQWTSPLLNKQSDYLVAISRFEVPMNRVPINREIKNAVRIYRYYDADMIAFSRQAFDPELELPNFMPVDEDIDLDLDQLLDDGTLAKTVSKRKGLQRKATARVMQALDEASES